MSISTLNHICLLVDNLELMMSFYIETLGLKLDRKISAPSHYICKMMNLSLDEKVEGVHLRMNQNPVTIEMLCFQKSKSASESKKELILKTIDRYGLNHIAFESDDITTDFAFMQSRNVICLSEPVCIPLYDINAMVKGFFVRDPEDNLIEIREKSNLIYSTENY